MTTAQAEKARAADRDEALIAFLESGAAADAGLAAWIERFPEASADIANAASARWARLAYGAPAEGETPDPILHARVRETGMAALHAFQRARKPVAAPLKDLLEAARERGLNREALAERLRLPYALVIKLHRRLIAPDSVPNTLISRLSEALDRTADEIGSYLRLPPTLAAGASYRADAAPRVGVQENFGEALAADPETTDEQRTLYLTDGA